MNRRRFLASASGLLVPAHLAKAGSQQGLLASASSLTTVTDPYASSVVLLLHFEGATGAGGGSSPGQSGYFADSSGKGHHIPSGNSSISYQTTAQVKFGSSSFTSNGSQYSAIPTSSDWSFGTADFSVEMWVRTGITGTPLSFQPRSSSPPYGVAFTQGISTGAMGLYERWNANIRNFTGGTDNGGWNFLTWNRVSGAWVVTMNGVVLTGANGGGDGIPASINLTATNGMLSNLYNDAFSTSAINGYMDEVRITKGVARWTGAHAVPTAAFPNP